MAAKDQTPNHFVIEALKPSQGLIHPKILSNEEKARE